MDAEQLTLPLRARRPWRTRLSSAARSTTEFTARWLLRILLPVAGAAALLRLFPYRGTAEGVHFRVEGSLLLRPGISADTTVGSWEFPHVSWLPVGAHISPRDVDVVTLASGATQNREAFVDALRSDIQDQIPQILAWLGVTVVLGVLLGLGAAAVINLAVRYLRGLPRRENELRIRGRQLLAATGVLTLIATFGIVTYDRDWPRNSRTTGTLAALQLFPNQLAEYYQQRSKFTDVIGGISSIQAQLQESIAQRANSVPAYNVMTISDMHLARTYPLVRQYATNFDVKLIINTGDESEFGTRAEMTPAYVGQIAELTRTVPMIWVAGNHDSPETIAVMRSIPGVTVLGTKFARDGGFVVEGEEVDVFGLTVAGLADPRVYGAAGEFGADDPAVVDPLERRAVDAAVEGVPDTKRFDIFATHEPVAAERLRERLPGQIRQTNSGHTHVQNRDDEIQTAGHIDLVEGTTGAGGLDNLNRGDLAPPPIAFSIETVSIDCQFTRVVRFTLGGTPQAGIDPLSTAEEQVSATTVYLDPNPDVVGRTCTPSLGLGEVRPIR